MGKNKIERDQNWKAFLERIRAKYGSATVFYLESLDYAGTRLMLEKIIPNQNNMRKLAVR